MHVNLFLASIWSYCSLTKNLITFFPLALILISSKVLPLKLSKSINCWLNLDFFEVGWSWSLRDSLVRKKNCSVYVKIVQIYSWNEKAEVSFLNLSLFCCWDQQGRRSRTSDVIFAFERHRVISATKAQIHFQTDKCC